QNNLKLTTLLYKKYNADIEIKNNQGKTPYNIAKENNYKDIMELLLPNQSEIINLIQNKENNNKEDIVKEEQQISLLNNEKITNNSSSTTTTTSYNNDNINNDNNSITTRLRRNNTEKII